jgi:carbon-monoxide dehydrogenase large subunit
MGRFSGRAIPRREDARLLDGRGKFVDDFDPTGVAHAAFVRSPHAHARIDAIEVPADAPGVLAVFTAADLEGRARPARTWDIPTVEAADELHPILAEDEVRYVGQQVAAVIAESRAAAEDAAELVEVTYEPLEPLLDPAKSAVELVRWEWVGGDVEAAFSAADRVVRATHALPRLIAAPLEARGALASYDPDADLLTMWCSAQDTGRPLTDLSAMLERDEDTIRIVVPDVGGAFGVKGALAPEAAVIAVAAMELARPVKWTEDRRENMLATYQGRGMSGEVELALTAQGQMLGLRARITADVGAYLYPYTHVPQHTAGRLMTGAYAIPAADVLAVGMQTNKVPSGPYRGAGRPEATYFLERTVDAAAAELGLDPVELRRRNLVREFPHATPLGWSWDSGDYERCLDRALELVEPEHGADADRVVGTGVALYVERAGGLWESAHASIEPDGHVSVRSGSMPHGQGHETTFAQIAAEHLGLELDQIVLEFGDSHVVPRGMGTFAGRSIAMGGSAMVVALDKVMAKAREVAARLLESPGQELTYENGRFSTEAGNAVGLAEIAAEGSRQADGGSGLEAHARFESEQVFGSGAYAAVVEIERATGRLTILRFAAVDDAGTIINPLLAEGQVIGATVQGLGASLTEEAVLDSAGQPLTTSLMDYVLLTAAEIPEMRTDFVESPSPINPLGAKGIGEGGTIGTPPAIASAVADALGRADLDPPFTEEKLWRALQEE